MRVLFFNGRMPRTTLAALWIALGAGGVVAQLPEGAGNVGGAPLVPGMSALKISPESPPVVDPTIQNHTTCPKPAAFDNQLVQTNAPLERMVGITPSIWFDNLTLFAGFDGARNPDDLGINANVGGRLAMQTAFPLIEQNGLAMQIGTAIDYHNTATRFQRLNGGPHERTQSFTTIGIFQRADSDIVWGVAYDFLHSHAYANLDVGQWRGLAGYRLNPDNEMGIWATYHDRGDAATFAGERFGLRAINQANLYWRHFWENEAMTRVWVGLADQHGRAILGRTGDTPAYNTFVYGAEFLVPLNAFVSIYAEANLITPLDSGGVNAFVGVAFYPGGQGKSAPRNRFAPLLPLANNANFALDAVR
jgi:hypothetical protein